MTSFLILNARIVNEGRVIEGDVLVRNGRIEKIATVISALNHTIIDANGKYLFPGVMDDQVHFREPGLTHKGDIFSESRAAVAGGVTSFMEMPNTVPNAVTHELLEEKYKIAAKNSPANYSFYMGATNSNLDEVKKTNPRTVCGVKIFMGSSTGNMLVDNKLALEEIFTHSPVLITTHCEDEETIRRNTELFKEKFGDRIRIEHHPLIRSEEACYLSSSYAVELAKKTNARLHVLHLSTAKETSLFDNKTPRSEKRITSEVCVHHLRFDDSFYSRKGNFIKWNPAIKTAADREGLLRALIEGSIDVVATDHAPHTKEEKEHTYLKAPSGGPLVQHSLIAMLEFVQEKKMSVELVADKMCHAVADCFRVSERGYLREGYFADMVLVDMEKPQKVTKENILAKCGWSPFEGDTFRSSVSRTFVNGNLVYENNKVLNAAPGMRLLFDH